MSYPAMNIPILITRLYIDADSVQGYALKSAQSSVDLPESHSTVPLQHGPT